MSKDIGRSIRVAMAKQDRTNIWLAKELDVSTARISQMKKLKKVDTDVEHVLLGVFNMGYDEFVALGE